MAESSDNLQAPPKYPSNDPQWKYVWMVKDDCRNDLKCKFCGTITKGGISRAKYHIAGGSTSVKVCTKAPHWVVEEIKSYKLNKAAMFNVNDNDYGLAKEAEANGPMDMYLTADKGKQTTINEAWKKEFRVKVCMAIFEWMYDVAIPFDALTYPSFQNMLNHIGQYGFGLQGPSMYEARVPFLSKAVQRTLINFLLNSPRGTVFLESVDASSYVKTGRKMFELIDKFVERIGESNVIQVVTDNASAMVLVGKLLQDKRPHLFWTPCAAHCVDLILEDIGKLPYIKDTLKKAMSVNAYIYVRLGVVNMLRHFTGEKELVRAGVTRFTTAFLTLERMQILKEKLRDMFRSRQWEDSQWKKEAGKKGPQWATFMLILPK
ncbi:hAT transposon superfamily [Striga asiatica]|uniref:HAT transposon superfamily n=1 Tax=Striga asiatica TaxID=4170 RepID=A0A5A7QW07_STRAF|nr:hAT transposon superfamily [Striga asiatica]